MDFVLASMPGLGFPFSQDTPPPPFPLQSLATPCLTGPEDALAQRCWCASWLLARAYEWLDASGLSEHLGMCFGLALAADSSPPRLHLLSPPLNVFVSVGMCLNYPGVTKRRLFALNLANRHGSSNSRVET